jgi:hypothetical protein
VAAVLTAAVVVAVEVSSDTNARRTASRLNSARYFDGRPIRDPFL